MLFSIYELKLGMSFIAQFSKFCAKLICFLHIRKFFVQFFKRKRKKE